MNRLPPRAVLSILLACLGLAAGPARGQNQDAAPPFPQTVAEPPPPATAVGTTLEECYREALQNNPAIRQARMDVEGAVGAKLVFDSIALPHVGLGGLGGQQGPRREAKKQIFILITGTFDQALFNAAIPATFRRGRIEVALAEQKLNQTLIGQIFELRSAFYQALDAREGLAVQESVRDRLRANYDAQVQQRQVGKVSNREISQAKIQLAAIEPGLAAARGAYRAAQIDLAQRLGRDIGPETASQPGEGLPIPSGTLDGEAVRIDFAAETAYALSHRPDLMALREMIQAAKEDSAIAHDGYWPRLDLVANGQYIPETAIARSGSVNRGQSSTQQSQILVGPSLTWTPYDGGTLQGQARTLDATRAAYQIQLQSLEDQVPRDLQQIAASLQKAAAQLEGSESNVALADQNLKQVEAQVANGDLPQLDFINAQTNLLQAHFNRLNALLENSLAIAQFELVTGRYLEFAQKKAPDQP